MLWFYQFKHISVKKNCKSLNKSVIKFQKRWLIEILFRKSLYNSRCYNRLYSLLDFVLVFTYRWKTWSLKKRHLVLEYSNDRSEKEEELVGRYLIRRQKKEISQTTWEKGKYPVRIPRNWQIRIDYSELVRATSHFIQVKDNVSLTDIKVISGKKRKLVSYHNKAFSSSILLFLFNSYKYGPFPYCSRFDKFFLLLPIVFFFRYSLSFHRFLIILCTLCSLI